jgi:hypothetical protein
VIYGIDASHAEAQPPRRSALSGNLPGAQPPQMLGMFQRLAALASSRSSAQRWATLALGSSGALPLWSLICVHISQPFSGGVVVYFSFIPCHHINWS